MRMILLFLSFLCIWTASSGQTDSSAVKSDSSKANGGYVFLPITYYTPDTRFAFGGSLVRYFKLKKSKNDTITRLSYAKALFDYTQNRQAEVWISWAIFTPAEKWLIKGEVRARNFPDRYYGIGNNTQETGRERYIYNQVAGKILVMNQFRDRMFVGADYQASYFSNMQYVADGNLKNGLVPGFSGGFSSGFGIVINSDTRDHVFTPRKGHLFEFSSYYFQRFLGSDFIFNTYNLLLNKYFTLPKQRVVAVQFITELNYGTIPFYSMAYAGGDMIIRGYARNRFRDNHLTAFQAEWRTPIYQRLGATVFGAIGDVYGPASVISLQNLKMAIGVGLRFSVNRKENVNVRIDGALARYNSAFYISIGEAF